MVTRYGSDGFQPGVIEVECGDLVHYDDYKALQAENERLKVEVKVTDDNLAFAMRSIVEIESQGYTAADVATAAADGFRDGVRSVDLERFRPAVEKAKAGCVTQAFENYCNELLALIDAHKVE